MNLATLKTEVTTDPLARGYSTMSDEQIADSLNTGNRTADRDTLTGGMVMSSIVRSEFAALSAADKQYIQLIVSCGEMPITTTLKTEFGAVFGAGTATRTNLVALLKRTGSRAEELGLGNVTPSNVADAKRS